MIDDGGIHLSEFQSRVQKCLSEMQMKKLDLMFVYGDSNNSGNLTYLTNFRPIGVDVPGGTGHNAIFLLAKDGSATLINDRTWFLDWVKEESWVPDIRADDQGDALGLSFEFLRKKKFLKGRIEADTRFMPAPVYRSFMANFARFEIDEQSRIVGNMRAVKSPKEIELISKSLEILGKANDAALGMAREGVSEADLAHEVRRVVMKEGADYLNSVFVHGGRRSTIALSSPTYTNYRMKKGDMVLVSAFCSYKKYYAGLDRNFVIGEASERQKKLAEIELKTLEESIRIAKPGRLASDFLNHLYEGFAEPLLKEAGFKDYNLQGYIGHGTGVCSAEAPVLWKLDNSPLKPGTVIHIEPGMYSKDPKIGGLRTADTILITEEGSKNLTNYPRRIGTLAQV
ncbi:MAG: xaa-pro dipeptidase (proline dipeptidase) [Deltaproteobacteria bacterium]|nr:xaa-pro dipeptidase (proline dipeptidase) [Deltaproteobacteria bacterium]